MGTQLNTLFRGNPTEVNLILEDTVLGEEDLRAALSNAFTRIDRLEQQLADRPQKPDLRNLTAPVLVTAATTSEAHIFGAQTLASAEPLIRALKSTGWTTTLFVLDGNSYKQKTA